LDNYQESLHDAGQQKVKFFSTDFRKMLKYKTLWKNIRPMGIDLQTDR